MIEPRPHLVLGGLFVVSGLLSLLLLTGIFGLLPSKLGALEGVGRTLEERRANAADMVGVKDKTKNSNALKVDDNHSPVDIDDTHDIIDCYHRNMMQPSELQVCEQQGVPPPPQETVEKPHVESTAAKQSSAMVQLHVMVEQARLQAEELRITIEWRAETSDLFIRTIYLLQWLSTTMLLFILLLELYHNKPESLGGWRFHELREAIADFARNAPPALGIMGTIYALVGISLTSGIWKALGEPGDVSGEILLGFYQAAYTTLVGLSVYILNTGLYILFAYEEALHEQSEEAKN